MTEEVEEKKVKRRFHPLSKWQRVTLHGWAENDTAYRSLPVLRRAGEV